MSHKEAQQGCGCSLAGDLRRMAVVGAAGSASGLRPLSKERFVTAVKSMSVRSATDVSVWFASSASMRFATASDNCAQLSGGNSQDGK